MKDRAPPGKTQTSAASDFSTKISRRSSLVSVRKAKASQHHAVKPLCFKLAAANRLVAKGVLDSNAGGPKIIEVGFKPIELSAYREAFVYFVTETNPRCKTIHIVF